MRPLLSTALAFALLVPLPARSQKDKDAAAVLLELQATKAALAKSEAARALAVAEQKRTTTALVSLAATNKSSAVEANANAGAAQFAADYQAALTRNASAAALASAQVAERATKLQAAQSETASAQLRWNSVTAAITTLGSVIVSILGFLYLDRKATLEHEWAKEEGCKTTEKLDAVHVLVNSNLTEAKQNELASMKSNLAALDAMFSIMRTSGHEPSTDALASTQALRLHIAELSAQIKDRLQATEVADSKVKA